MKSDDGDPLITLQEARERQRVRDLSPESLDGRFCGGVEARRQIPSLASDDLWDVRVRESECMTELRERQETEDASSVSGCDARREELFARTFSNYFSRVLLLHWTLGFVSKL